MKFRYGKNIYNSLYPGIMERADSFLLDSLFFIPFFLLLNTLTQKLNSRSDLMALCIFLDLLKLLLPSLYRIIFTKTCSATPGKLICGFKIVREDRLSVNWETAIKRESIQLSLSTLYLLFFYITFFINKLNIYTFADAEKLFAPSILSKIYACFLFVVFFIDYVLLITISKSEQTLHDIIAKTVVVYKTSRHKT